MPANRRGLLTASIGLAFPAIRSAVTAPPGMAIAAYGGLFQEIFEPAIVAPFGRTHRDVGVTYQAVPGPPAQMLALLRRQREMPSIDVVIMDLAAARTATDEGLLEPLSRGFSPVLSELTPMALVPGVAGLALFTEPLVLLCDLARTRPVPNWKGLWSGSGGGSLAIPAPPDPAGIGFALVAGRLFGGGNEPRAVQDGITAIHELAARVVSWNPRPDVSRFIGYGDAMFGVGWNMQAQIWSDRLGGRLGVVFPDEGTLSRVTTVNLVKGSRQPEVARQFIAWLLGAEAQRLLVEQMFLGPVNAHARYAEGALLRTANTPERAARAIAVDWVEVGSSREKTLRVWREVMGAAAG